MDSYLMMLYVTLEQESAMKILFMDQGWAFCKPDLSVTTDKLGPAIGGIPTDNQGNGSSSGLKNKRKSKSSLNNAPVIKQAKIVPVASATMSKKQTVSLKNADTQNDGINEASNACTSPVNISTIVEEEGGRKILIKVETTDRDYEDNDDVNADDDDMNADDDDTDVDYSFDEIEDRETGAELDVSEASENKDSKTGVIPKLEDGLKPDGSKSETTIEAEIEELLFQSQGTSTERAASCKYMCCICDKQIKLKYNMKRHLRSHLPNQINCVMCNRFFDSVEKKEQHMLDRHSNRHMCETCGVSFRRKSDLNTHMFKHIDSVDEGTMSHVCFRCPDIECRKLFFRQSNYQYHLNTHSGHKPFKCEGCDKTFHSEYTKNSHEKDCLYNTEYICEICESVFKQRSGLHNHKQAEHVRGERGYTCEVCSQKFKFSTGLIRHKKEKHQLLDASQQTEAAEIVEFVEQVIHVPRSDEMTENGREHGTENGKVEALTVRKTELVLKPDKIRRDQVVVRLIESQESETQAREEHCTAEVQLTNKQVQVVESRPSHLQVGEILNTAGVQLAKKHNGERQHVQELLPHKQPDEIRAGGLDGGDVQFSEKLSGKTQVIQDEIQHMPQVQTDKTLVILDEMQHMPQVQTGNTQVLQGESPPGDIEMAQIQAGETESSELHSEVKSSNIQSGDTLQAVDSEILESSEQASNETGHIHLGRVIVIHQVSSDLPEGYHEIHDNSGH